MCADEKKTKTVPSLELKDNYSYFYGNIVLRRNKVLDKDFFSSVARPGKIQRKTLFLAIMLMIIIGAASSAFAAGDVAYLFFDPQTTQVNPGDTFDVNINLSYGAKITGVDIQVAFDPAVLEAQKIEPAGVLKGVPLITVKQDKNNEKGWVWLAGAVATKEEAVNGAGTLARISFKALKAGVTTLDFNNASLIYYSNASPPGEGQAIPVAIPVDTSTAKVTVGKGAPERPAAPEADPKAGSYDDNVTVILSCDTAGANIFYTLNGGEPGTSSAKYTAPITINKDTRILTVAVKDDLISAVSSFYYSLRSAKTSPEPPAAPAAAPVEGEYTGSVNVSLTCSTQGALIYYTTDGSDPKTSITRQQYSSALTFTQNTILKAAAYKENLYSKEIAAFNYSVSDGQGLVVNRGVSPASNEDKEVMMFKDLSSRHWAASSIAPLLDKKIVAGYEDKTFHPDSSISRAEFASLIVRAEGAGDASEEVLQKFKDKDQIPPWAKKSVATAASLELIRGDGNGCLRAGDSITRAEVAAVLIRLLSKEENIQTAAGIQRFKDITDHWAASTIALASGQGLVSGYPDNTFQPDKPVTRAEACAMIIRLLHLTNKL